jgi:Domain of unknown function (DUF4181)
MRMGLYLLKLILLVLIFFLLLYAAHLAISSWLGVERRKIWSHEIIINEHHEKADKIHRWTMVIFLISCPVIDVFYDFEHWYQNPYIYFLLILLSSNLTKAYMERKYIEDKREYRYTLFETGIISILLSLLFVSGNWFLS